MQCSIQRAKPSICSSGLSAFNAAFKIGEGQRYALNFAQHGLGNWLNGFGPAEDFLAAFRHPLAERVALLPSGPAVNGQPLVPFQEIRRIPQGSRNDASEPTRIIAWSPGRRRQVVSQVEIVTVMLDEHAVSILNRAGWHGSSALTVPANITLVSRRAIRPS